MSSEHFCCWCCRSEIQREAFLTTSRPYVMASCVSPDGFEPSTNCLKGSCSAVELWAHHGTKPYGFFPTFSLIGVTRDLCTEHTLVMDCSLLPELFYQLNLRIIEQNRRIRSRSVYYTKNVSFFVLECSEFFILRICIKCNVHRPEWLRANKFPDRFDPIWNSVCDDE